MARSIECKCDPRFTCGYCLRNAKPYIFTPSTAEEQFRLSQDRHAREQGTRDGLVDKMLGRSSDLVRGEQSNPYWRVYAAAYRAAQAGVVRQ